MVTRVNLTQFDNYKDCPWIQGLISLSSDFFVDKKVFNGCLWLEQRDETSMDKALQLLNEASSVDFKYTLFKDTSVTVDKIYQYYKKLQEKKDILMSLQ
jgi:hypothetical protein